MGTLGGSLAMSLIWPPQSCLNLVAFCNQGKEHTADEQAEEAAAQSMGESKAEHGGKPADPRRVWQIPLATCVRDKAVLCGTAWL